MARKLPVVWSFRDEEHAGALELVDGRIVLQAARGAMGLSLANVVHASVERGAAARLRGLPVVRLVTRGELVVCIASLGGAGTLHELAQILSV